MKKKTKTEKKNEIHSPLPLITLRGDISESFYQLGVRDRKNFEDVRSHLESIIATSNKIANGVVAGGTLLLAQKVIKNNPSLVERLGPYAEGLSIPLASLVSHYLIPEILSALNVVLPPIPFVFPTPVMGCSSFFLRDEATGAPLHGRILDFPLVGTFEKRERGLLYDFQGLPKIWSHGVSGLPYPSLTAMNSEGISLCLHQKFTNKFYPDGNLIFDIAHRLLTEGHSVSSVKKLLPSLKSLTTWGVFLTFKDGTVLCLDLCGEKITKQEFHLAEKDILYFANRTLSPNPPSPYSSVLPYGMENYCGMRHQTADKKLSHFRTRKETGETDTALELLKMMGRPFILKASSAKNWTQDVITFNTVATVVLNPTEGKVLHIPGPAPKILGTEVYSTRNLWKGTPQGQQTLIKTGMPAPRASFVKGMRNLALATAFYDKKNFRKAYHHIQMGIHFLEGHPEKWVARFYFLVFQYIHTQNAKEFPLLLDDFKALKDKLPSYLNDHRLLFVSRLHILSRKNENQSPSPEEIEHPSLRKILLWERRLPAFVLKRLRSLIFPQMGILDIVYGYFKE